MLAIEESRDNWQAEPTESRATSTPRVLSILASVLEELVTKNDHLATLVNGSRSPSPANKGANDGPYSEVMGKSCKVFDGVRAPSISIPMYLERIYKYVKCSPSCFVVGYVYIDRLIHRHPELLVVSLNVHRLVVASVMVASKILDDDHYNNAFYAKVGGVSNSELNRLELELLFLLDFELVVSAPVFESYCLHLERQNTRIEIAHSITVKEDDGPCKREEIAVPIRRSRSDNKLIV